MILRRCRREVSGRSFCQVVGFSAPDGSDGESGDDSADSELADATPDVVPATAAPLAASVRPAC